MLRDFFKKTRYAILDVPTRPVKVSRPGEELDNINKCNDCGDLIYLNELEENLKVCPRCGNHLKLTARERLTLTLDKGSFKEYDQDLETLDPLEFPGYKEKLASARESTGLKEAVITGEGYIDGIPLVIGVMDQHFITATMGTVVGEKIFRALERAREKGLPVIIFAASGGARMQEGIYSLMQMAKTSAAVARFQEAGLLYISVLTNPTTGGVTASFASLGDIIIAEPGALIGFAGARVIEQTIRQKLPPGFQRAEFFLQHGQVDLITARKELRQTLSKLLALHRRDRGGRP